MLLDLVPDWLNDASNHKVISFRLSLTIGQMQRNRQFHPDMFGASRCRGIFAKLGSSKNAVFPPESAYVCRLLCTQMGMQTNTASGTVILSPRYNTWNKRRRGRETEWSLVHFSMCVHRTCEKSSLTFKALRDPFDILWPAAHPWSPPIHGSRQKWLGSNHRHPFPAARRTCTLDDQVKQT